MSELEAPSDAVSLASAIADYTESFAVDSDSAIDMARRCLIDALSRGFEALRDPSRASLVGPLVPGAMMPGGARVPGTSLELDPPQAAFCLGAMFWPTGSRQSDPEPPTLLAIGPLAALLATADYRARKATMEGIPPPKIRDVLAATVKAVEIQGVLAHRSDRRRTESVPVRLTRLAATAVSTAQLGGTRGQIVSALSYACADGGVRAEGADKDEPHDSEHRQWLTADAISRAVRHGCQAVASGRSAQPTPIAVPPEQPFGTGAIERLADGKGPQDAEPLRTRFRVAVDRHFPPRQAERIKLLFATPERLDDQPVNEVLAAMVTNGAR